jgi:hypothetical protein
LEHAASAQLQTDAAAAHKTLADSEAENHAVSAERSKSYQAVEAALQEWEVGSELENLLPTAMLVGTKIVSRSSAEFELGWHLQQLVGFGTFQLSSARAPLN